jgi:hypothetical protein
LALFRNFILHLAVARAQPRIAAPGGMRAQPLLSLFYTNKKPAKQKQVQEIMMVFYFPLFLFKLEITFSYITSTHTLNNYYSLP